MNLWIKTEPVKAGAEAAGYVWAHMYTVQYTTVQYTAVQYTAVQ